jgi:hypothetical protein
LKKVNNSYFIEVLRYWDVKCDYERDGGDDRRGEVRGGVERRGDGIRVGCAGLKLFMCEVLVGVRK